MLRHSAGKLHVKDGIPADTFLLLMLLGDDALTCLSCLCAEKGCVWLSSLASLGQREVGATPGNYDGATNSCLVRPSSHVMMK
jgi:hypothetical protein